MGNNSANKTLRPFAALRETNVYGVFFFCHAKAQSGAKSFAVCALSPGLLDFSLSDFFDIRTEEHKFIEAYRKTCSYVLMSNSDSI